MTGCLIVESTLVLAYVLENTNHFCYKFINFSLSSSCAKTSETDTLHYQTRMHSSRMRTGRSLTVCWSLLPGGGGVWSGEGVVLGGVCGPGGWSRGVWSGGVWSWGVSLPGGGVSLPETPPVDRITDACKNITLAQLRCGR